MESTFLQIDLQSLFIAAGKNRIDFEKVWDYFNDRDSEHVIDSVIYNSLNPKFNSSKFELKMKNLGYKMKSKEIPNLDRWSPDISVLITMDCLMKKDSFDKWILMSNNGSFSEICKYLKAIGKKVEVWEFRNMFDSKLKDFSDNLYYVEDEFCFEKNVHKFGFNKEI